MRARLAVSLILSGLAFFACKSQVKTKESLAGKPVGLPSTGEMLSRYLPLEIEEGQHFSEGLAGVRINGRWGFIDTTGKVCIKPEYKEVERFSSGVALVRKASTYELIDRNGKNVIEPKTGITNFFDSLGFVDSLSETLMLSLKTGATYKLDKETEDDAVMGFSEGFSAVFDGAKWGFVDWQARLVIPHRFEDVLPFTEGLCAVRLKGKWGYIDTTGEMVIQPQFKRPGIFRDGLAAVYLDTSAVLCGTYIDRDGRIVSSRRFYLVQEASAGLAPAAARKYFNEIESKVIWFYYDVSNNNYLDGIYYDHATPFHEGLAAVCNQGKWGYIERSGQIAIELQYEEAGDFSDNRALVKQDGKWFYIDSTGQRMQLIYY